MKRVKAVLERGRVDREDIRGGKEGDMLGWVKVMGECWTRWMK